ncbi:MAG: FTR1 family protein [Solirubrobacteraceae bacterium]
MVAAALTFREALEVWLVVAVLLSFVGGSAREHVRPLIIALGAAFLLGSAIGAAAGVFGASLDTKAKAIFQASMMGLGALLMTWAVLTKPPYVRLERRLATRADGDPLSVASDLFRALIPITILTSVLLYGCAAGAWGAADLFGGVLGSAMGVVVGLLGAAALVSFERLEPRTWRVLIYAMLFVFFAYLVVFEAGALPQAGLIPSRPHVGPDRGVSPIATVFGIVSVVLIVRLALRRGELQPRLFLALVNPLFIGLAAYFVVNAIQTLALWDVITFPEEASWGVLVVATILLGVGFLRDRTHVRDSEWVHPLVSRIEGLASVQRVRRRWPVVRGRRPTPLSGDESARR